MFFSSVLVFFSFFLSNFSTSERSGLSHILPARPPPQSAEGWRREDKGWPRPPPAPATDNSAGRGAPPPRARRRSPGPGRREGRPPVPAHAGGTLPTAGGRVPPGPAAPAAPAPGRLGDSVLAAALRGAPPPRPSPYLRRCAGRCAGRCAVDARALGAGARPSPCESR